MSALIRRQPSRSRALFWNLRRSAHLNFPSLLANSKFNGRPNLIVKAGPKRKALKDAEKNNVLKLFPD